MRVEVRAVGLKAIREQKGLTQRKLGRDLGISQNFRVPFETIFGAVLVDSEAKRERLLGPTEKR